MEASYDDPKLKNELCRPVPHPDEAIDLLLVFLQSHRNGLRWNAQPKTFAWLGQARLDWFGTFLPPVPEDQEEQKAFFAAFEAQIEALCAKLEKLLTDLPEKDAVRMKAQLERFYAQ